MELQQVRYFIAVFETRNFTRASERCGVSQPALTTAIRKLEDELGGPLFHRDRSGAVLTGLGELLLPRFRQLLGESTAIEEIARNNLLLRGAPLRIGVLRTIGPGRIAPELEVFRRRAPAVELEVRLLNPSTLLAQLEEAALDVVIASPPEVPPPWLVVRSLYVERYLVILPPQHPLTKKKVVSLTDLNGERYVDRLACELRERIQIECRKLDVELYASYRTEDEAWIECLVRAGIGFAFMPEHSIVAAGSLGRPLTEPSVTRAVALLRSADHEPSPAARAFWNTFDRADPENVGRG